MCFHAFEFREEIKMAALEAGGGGNRPAVLWVYYLQCFGARRACPTIFVYLQVTIKKLENVLNKQFSHGNDDLPKEGTANFVYEAIICSSGDFQDHSADH